MKELYEELFGQYDTKLTKLDSSIFRIRPSSIESFFNFPAEWCREFILKQDRPFKGSTSTVLGTVLHKCYEYAMVGKNLKKEDIDACIIEYDRLNPAICNPEEIIQVYPSILEEVLNTFIHPLASKSVAKYTEQEFIYEVQPNYVVRGIADLQYGTIISDYKNVSTKPNIESIPFGYKMQLLCAALALKKQGKLIDTIEIVYGVRPTKTLGARCFVVREIINPIMLQQVNEVLDLIAGSVELVKTKPELINYIFKSMKLEGERDNVS